MDFSFNKENVGQVLLGILFILYLVMGYDVPSFLSEAIDTLYGKIAVVVIFLLLFSFVNPVLGVLGFIVAYELIRRSSVSTGTHGLTHYVPTEQKKSEQINAMNQFPYTLEQEVVKKMAPSRDMTEPKRDFTFLPVLDDTYDAAPINYTGVV